MQSPAIQVAVHNLVEAIRTSLMAEFLELLRQGKPARAKPGPKPRAKAATNGKKAAKRPAKVVRKAARSAAT